MTAAPAAPDTGETAVQIYRTRLAVERTSTSSSGEVKYYESIEDLKEALLAAQLDVLLRQGIKQVDRHVHRRRQLWREFLLGDNGYPKVTEIFHVDQLVEGRWVPLDVVFHEPTVEVHFARKAPSRTTQASLEPAP